MKAFLQMLGLLSYSFLSMAQNVPQYYEGEYKTYREIKLARVTHIDYNFYYEVIIPQGFEEEKTNSSYIFKGKLPPIETIVDEITITCIDKDEFESFNAFKEYIIKPLIPGNKPSWNHNYQCIEMEDLGRKYGKGLCYKVRFNFNGEEIIHTYALFESKTACIWIDFKSKPNTYFKNILLFEEFINSFKLT